MLLPRQACSGRNFRTGFARGNRWWCHSSNFAGLFRALVVGFHLAIFAGASRGESAALVVTGLAGTSANEEEFARLAGETKRLLVERGIPLARVETLTDKVTRAAVLEKLAAAAGKGSAADEFWLVLYGHSGKSRGDVPAFQVSGPRLTAEDLKTALDAIPGRQFVVIGTNESGAYLPILQSPRRTVLSATKGDGESDQPRFPAAWVEAFAQNPKASFAWIAAQAAERVSAEYLAASLAQFEHARLADPTTGTILEPPFGVNLTAPAETATASADSPAPSDGPAAIKVEIHDPSSEWERQAATDETKRIMAEAKAVPNPAGDAALVLEQRQGFTVAEDRTTDRTVSFRVLIGREDAADEWANFSFPQSPPAVTTKLEAARVIHPDGSSLAFNPAKLPGATNADANGDAAEPRVFLPDVHAGCVIEVAWRTRQILDATLPHVSEEIPLQQSVPVLKTALEIRVPVKPVFRVGLAHADAAPTERVENGRRILDWQLGRLPAAAGLPGDPPFPLWAVVARVSSLPSWDEFAAWYRRLADGSDAIDPTVKKTAAEVMAGADSRQEKIRRAFEFVSSLRYVAIEIGVQGFRPRTPARVLANRYGDCKDKANLLGAMLRSQGIDAEFVLLNRGSFTDVTFPSWQFNHAICRVPGAPGTDQPEDLWLDATDSTAPFGFVPPGDYGREGLVFGKDKAEFQPVVTKNHAPSEIADEWELTAGADGGWSGVGKRTATGFAEDDLRKHFRGLAPAQRDFKIYDAAANLWPGADFRDGAVSDMSDLRAPAWWSAQVVSAGPDLPPGNATGLEAFVAPDRDRALWLNDGQPMVLRQTLRLHPREVPTALPSDWERATAGETLRIRWRRIDDRTVERTTVIELPRAIVEAADYAALRGSLRDWTAALRAPVFSNPNPNRP
jgi:hypothetical protein